ncbi:hypothetical protein BMS3Abin07_01191 [bacterium BMS3Abin07]|nr:hypothetical protein BMS3Abin07_01191 [bacterium BMS3Abin07]GBE31515.1 hypothetical protein BMS3Bbin05_00416 [bacterium BMS3Bbin05]HDO21230.1 hypothetical protein [Nitrospirota bacterium]
MSFDVLQEKKPSYSISAMIVIVFLAAILLGIGIAFAYLLISGKGNDYIMGTLLAFVFLIAGIEVVLYARYFVAFREVSEDREEELLW